MGAVKATLGGVGRSLGLGLAVVSVASSASMSSTPSSRGKGMMRGGLSVSDEINSRFSRFSVVRLKKPHSMFFNWWRGITNY